TPLPETVLAVPDELRLVVGREYDVHDLPVALVRLPEQTARCERIGVDVVVVEVPVLQHRLVSGVRDAAVDQRSAAALVPGGRVTRQAAERCSRRAGALVQPPRAASSTWQVTGTGVGVSNRPRAA